MCNWAPLKTAAILLLLVISGCSNGQVPEDTGATRRWVGADYFAIPLHDWSRQGESFIARPASYGGRWDHSKSRLYHATATVGGQGKFSSSFRVKRLEAASSGGQQAGLWLGLLSRTPSPMNVWIHPPKTPLFIGIAPRGRLHVGDRLYDVKLDPEEGAIFHITGRVGPQFDQLDVRVKTGRGRQIHRQLELPAGSLSGSMSLFAQGADSVWRFDEWTVRGEALQHHPERSVGPILWSQYTLQDNGTLKLQAQMVPLEDSDPRTAVLQFNRGGAWEAVASATLEPLSSTFLFRVGQVTAEAAIPYRVVYGAAEEGGIWEGTIRANPRDEDEFTLGVFSCDQGYLFSQDGMVRNVGLQDPDMLFFAGDQIYENMDRVRIVEEPLEGARLSYLGKYYQFGLTWRQLLRDRPSVIIPDDHDVFMGNVWGEGGRGYSMDPAWVNMVQRTQTGSLPDPVDPEPVERGIEVYFTALDYAGMSFAIIEDRKFKSHPRIAGPIDKVKAADPADLDVPGAVLLGQRQLSFLSDWTERTSGMPARWFLSQSILAKATTHTGPELQRVRYDMDSNGWPQSGRNRALAAIARDTLMVTGDQHLGMLARLGIEQWDDGPLSFLVTGTAVGFPRAWWPERTPEGGEINGPYTGRFLDDFGNRITVHGVANPEHLPPGITDANNRPELEDRGVLAVQQAKGAGHGLVILDKRTRRARFELYRLLFDAAQPRHADQFPGFPITLSLDPAEPGDSLSPSSANVLGESHAVANLDLAGLDDRQVCPQEPAGRCEQ